ncbi:MAG TPA: radical SAM protein [Candidatus Sulfotelmatobacter sp.]|nr:radical SAM protein [Candidatus Sulfotelmatobacter sp.]
MPATRPYLFYDVTLSICSTCYRKVEGKTVFQDNNVYLVKRCPQHGSEKVLIADDVDYYRRCREIFIKPSEMPLVYNTPVKWGCPYDCGLCTDHEQHSCLTLVEICDYCNLRCPVCYAESGPDRPQFRSLDQVEKMLDAVVRNEGHPDVVQLSGGEPTVHPDFFEIVELAKARPIRHLMVNTNGLRVAQDEDFVKRLADVKEDFEVYLQFDSFEREPMMQLRGADLRRVREEAIENLDRYNISTNLVVTLKKGLNDHEIGETIDYALKQPCVRGVTFQPIQDAGRINFSIGTDPAGSERSRTVRPAEQSEASDTPECGCSSDITKGGSLLLPDFGGSGRFDGGKHPGRHVRNFNPATDRLTLTEVRRKILEQTTVFKPEDIIPVPCHPDSLAMAYALKLNGKVTPLTSMIPPEVLIKGAANTILYEQEPAVREGLFKLFATNHSPQSQAGTLRELLCCLPKVWIPNAITADRVETDASPVPQKRSDVALSHPGLTYENIFRVIIMQFIDAHSFDVRSVKKTCVHIVHPDGRLIPFDTYNLFYRDDLEQIRLAPLRRAAEAAQAALV